MAPGAGKAVGGSVEDVDRAGFLNGATFAQPLQGAEAGSALHRQGPKIPVTYLASTSEGHDKQGFSEEYNTKIVQLQQDYVDRFSPGALKEVDAPHFMEPVIPDRIAAEVREVIAAAGGR